jgi:hypothetical protein
MCSAVATELPPYFWTMIPRASYLPTLLHQNSILSDGYRRSERLRALKAMAGLL